MDIPTYKTYASNREGQLPLFISTVTVAGKSFTGDGGKSKEEAEQLAAHAAFHSLRGTLILPLRLKQILAKGGQTANSLN